MEERISFSLQPAAKRIRCLLQLPKKAAWCAPTKTERVSRSKTVFAAALYV